ncbi:hypothetical protein E4L96_00085 [Massilia arenosa]|uniref:Outer membrane protein beta-barrel domain-containing protein n=1 Tax=Zemynaea arenosa TaxID=2561931 RepID=A0A4Y9SVC1_9BURK|nr:outer membrane beta-barrel protein [Massilia arenosa]TFW30415.1 hypothetical protein E4L96_00085 [Massilia arenosa]
MKKTALIAALALFATAASAADTILPGFYAGADLGRSTADDYDGHETSYGGFLGYQINQNFAAELGYRRLADTTVRFAGYNVDAKVDQTAISVLGIVPLQKNFSVYGRLGYNHLKAKASLAGYSASDSDNKVLYGVGVTYAFTPAIVGRAEVQRPSSDSTNLSVGVAFTF